MPFYKYRTDQGNTVVAYQDIAFTGLTVNEAQVSSALVIPTIQPPFQYKVSAGIVVPNDDATINSYSVNVLGIPVNSSYPVTGGTVSGSLNTTGTISEGGNLLTLKYASKPSFLTYTGTTAPAQFAAKATFNLYTGTTAPATYHTKAAFNSYSATTAPAQFAAKATFNLYTGTTAPATYHTRTAFNSYSATTAPAQFAAKTAFNLYTGTTAPAIYHTKSAFNSYSATTAPAQFAAKTAFNLYTGTTAPAQFAAKTPFNLYTGTTAPNAFVAKSVFSTYTGGTTNVTSASNGIRKNGNNVRLGGSLTGSTNIGLNTFNLVFTGTTGTLRYGSDLAAQYGVRSLVDKGFVTGITSTLVQSVINGLSESPSGVARLGGNLTGATTITSPATGSRLSFAGFPVQYSADLSANFNLRSIPDVGWVTGSTVTFFKEKITTQTTTSATLADYDTITVNLPLGNYRVTYGIIVGHSATNANCTVEFRRAGANAFPSQFIDRPSQNTLRMHFSMSKYFATLSGSQTFSVAIATGGATMTAYYSSIIIEKLSS